MLCRIDLFCDAANGSSGHYVSLHFLIVVMLGLHSALNERWNAPKMAEQFRCKRERKKRDEGEEKETYKKIEAAGAEQEEIKNDSVEFETLIDDCRYRIAGEEELRVVYSR